MTDGAVVRQDRDVRARQVYDTIDRQGFQLLVVFVAGVGFFLDGYTVSHPCFGHHRSDLTHAAVCKQHGPSDDFIRVLEKGDLVNKDHSVQHRDIGGHTSRADLVWVPG